MIKKTKQTKTPANQRNSVKRRNIIVVFLKAFSIFLWQLFCWCMVTLYRKSMKNPLGASGIAIFLVLFGFVSYNALFSQESYHNSPFFETRSHQQQNMAPERNAETALQANNVPTTSNVATPNAVSSSDASAAQENANLANSGVQQNNTNGNALAQMPPVTPSGDQSNGAGTSIAGTLSLPNGANAPIPVMMPQTTSSAAPTASAVSQDLMSLQKQMANAGFYDGAIDGLNGPQTRAAIEKWEKRNGSQVQTAAISAQTSTVSADPITTNSITKNSNNRAPVNTAQLNANTTNINSGNTNSGNSAATNGNIDQADIFRVQTGLRLFGYSKVAISGVEDEATREALKAFQTLFSLQETGRINPEVIAKMKEINIFG